VAKTKPITLTLTYLSIINKQTSSHALPLSILKNWKLVFLPYCTGWSRKRHKVNDTIILQPYVTEPCGLQHNVSKKFFTRLKSVFE